MKHHTHRFAYTKRLFYLEEERTVCHTVGGFFCKAAHIALVKYTYAHHVFARSQTKRAKTGIQDDFTVQSFDSNGFARAKNLSCDLPVAGHHTYDRNEGKDGLNRMRPDLKTQRITRNKNTAAFSSSIKNVQVVNDNLQRAIQGIRFFQAFQT